MTNEPTLQALIACGIHPTQARLFEEPLRIACARFQINTPTRLAAFLAQAIVESRGFSRLEEDLYYRTPERIRAMFPSTPERIRAMFPSTVPDLATAARLVGKPQQLANRVYANRNGNGDEASGDGWRFRGRGGFQLTGRGNYRLASTALGDDYVEAPHLVALPHHAALTSAWFFQWIGGNRLADSAQIDAITRKINPAMVAADERRSHYTDNMRALV